MAKITRGWNLRRFTCPTCRGRGWRIVELDGGRACPTCSGECRLSLKQLAKAIGVPEHQLRSIHRCAFSKRAAFPPSAKTLRLVLEFCA